MPPSPHVSAAVRFGLALSLLTLGLTGCAADQPDEAVPRKNLAQWTSPLDGFVPKKLVAASYASLLLDARCMYDAGYLRWAVPWREVDPDNGPGWNAVEMRLFNADLAASYGYRIPPAVRSDTNPEWRAFVSATNGALPKAEDEQFTRCADGNRKKNRAVNIDGGTLNIAMGYMSLASDKARASGEVKAAEGRWQTCMAPEGISDLPQTPEEMPSDSVDAKFGIAGALDAPAPAGEIEIAVADARCRESSGYSRAFYDIRWDESLRLYHENRDRLERARERIAAHDKAVQEVISSYAPSRPGP